MADYSSQEYSKECHSTNLLSIEFMGFVVNTKATPTIAEVPTYLLSLDVVQVRSLMTLQQPHANIIMRLGQPNCLLSS